MPMANATAIAVCAKRTPYGERAVSPEEIRHTFGEPQSPDATPQGRREPPHGGGSGGKPLRVRQLRAEGNPPAALVSPPGALVSPASALD
jgi:hypothetical protein